MTDLSGKTVLLTGALGSLGRAQARAFTEAGAALILLDRPDHADASAFTASLGDRAVFVGQDLAVLREAEAAVRAIADQRGGIDVLVNNAALIINKPFEAFSLDEYEEQVRVNSSAAFALVRAVAPGMKARRGGRIINFCSVTLNGQWDGYVPYVASKGAMLGLTKSLARELGPFGIGVNAVSPGAVVSEAEARVFGERAQEYSDWIIKQQCSEGSHSARGHCGPRAVPRVARGGHDHRTEHRLRRRLVSGARAHHRR